MSETPSPNNVIISRTPLRVSLCGGGTDLDQFSMSNSSGGRVVSLAIDKYVYVTMNRRFDDSIRVSYSSTENADSVDDVQHDLVREAMRLTGTDSGVEITTIADIPGRGTGLGSSSSVTVGLLHAMHAFHGRQPSKEQLAEEACHIEIEILGAPIGRQDQYAGAFGGINSISFGSNGVIVEPIGVSEELISSISNRFSLVFTGLTRSANKVLSRVVEDIESKNSSLKEIRNHANLAAEMMESGDLDSLGQLLNSSWLVKRETSSNVSNYEIDKLYNLLISFGAKGAKLLGAGSGGFFLVYGDDSLRQQITNKLGIENRVIPVGIDFSGSQIIHGY